MFNGVRLLELAVCLVLLLGGALTQAAPPPPASGAAQVKKTITNPIAPDANDPWVLRHNGAYYYCYSRRGGIWVNRAGTLKEVLQRNGQCVWRPEPDQPYSRQLWAPELHRIGDRWYIYFAADDGENANHRMYVLTGAGDDPMGPYTLAGRLAAQPDRWAIDGTVLQYRGQLYFIWSGWEGEKDVSQELYIARMKSPTEVEGERVQISRPDHDWERSRYPINEGPEALEHNGCVFIIYSADASWTDAYCLGQLELVGEDPLDPKAWKKKSVPVFSPTADVFGPGHCSFIKSPDGSEDWIIYHSAKEQGSGWGREGRAQRFEWTAEGQPKFGAPLPEGVEMSVPSGE